MEVAQDLQSQMFHPLQEAFNASALDAFPGMVLTQESQKALAKLSERVATDVAEGTVQALEDQLQNFGPSNAPDSEPPEPDHPSGPSDSAAFNNDTENGTIPKENIPTPVKAEKFKGTEAPIADPATKSNEQEASGQENPDPQGEQAAEAQPGGGNFQEEGAPPDGSASDPETLALQAKRDSLPSEKGAITQGLNSLLNRRKIKKLKKLIDKLGKDLQQWQKLLARQKKTLSRVQKQKKRLDNMKSRVDRRRRLLSIFNWTGGFIIFCGVLEFTIPWKKLLDAKSARIQEMIDPLQERIKKIEGAITVLNKQIKSIENKMSSATMDLYATYNQGIMQQRLEARGSATPNT